MTSTQIENLRQTNQWLSVIERHYGKRIVVTSMFRTKEKNDRVGGVKTSQHLQGKAMDIWTENLEILYQTIINLMEKGIIPDGYVKLYDNHIHYDWRNRKP